MSPVCRAIRSSSSVCRASCSACWCSQSSCSSRNSSVRCRSCSHVPSTFAPSPPSGAGTLHGGPFLEELLALTGGCHRGCQKQDRPLSRWENGLGRRVELRGLEPP